MQRLWMVEVVLSANPKDLHLLSKTNVLAPTGQLARDLGSYNDHYPIILVYGGCR